MLRFLPIFLVLFFTKSLSAQLPYTTAQQYAWRVDSNLQYGTAVNYMGATVDLRLDLYKPIGDHNLQRPLLVLVHGGTWISGCKYDMAWLAEEMAGRGYAVATINYRLGWHKDDYVAAPICPFGEAARQLYPADSCEIIRALYRAQQDVKGAIRWLRCRHLADSTSVCQVLVGGESAGAFTALAVGLLDRASEKPDCCAALPAAPSPDANLLNRTTMDCGLQNWTIPPGSLGRPDLGSVDGDLNQNGYAANVSGILSFFGGVPTEGLTKDWLGGPDTPAIYLYHQTCDGIVPFNYGKPTVTISAYCNLGCTPWHSQYPNIYGNGAIAAYFATLAQPPAYLTDFDSCDPFNPGLALFECARYANNGSYHFSANRPLRAQKVAGFFSPVITAAPCTAATVDCSSGTAEQRALEDIQVRPNPFQERISVFCALEPAGRVVLQLLDATGRLVWQEQRELQTGENEFIFPK
ncbi:MAG: alpha/beta hydrolase, partial [Saprospiraceae bacterium]